MAVDETKPEIKIHCKFDEMVKLTKFKNHPKNRNKHPKTQIDRLADLYKYHGIRHPIIISLSSGYIVAGHGRKQAAQKAGLKEFPCVYQDFESEEAEYAFLISDNAMSMWSEFDYSMINEDIQEMGPDFDLDMLGIENFTVDVAEKFEEEPKDKTKDLKFIECPHCGQEFEKSHGKSRAI